MTDAVAPSPSDSSARGSILVVDDVPDNLRLLSSVLSNEGYIVRCVVSGAAALMGAQAHPPDLILLDVMMPEMDGYQVCQHLKENERTKRIPIIFISALDEAWDKVRAFTVGGVDYVTKPFQVVEVLARINTHITLSRQQQELMALNIRQHEMEKLHQLKDNFLSRISHELRTPLASMRMAIRMAAQAPSEEKRAHYLEILESECDREIELVEDLLRVRGLEAGTQILAREVITLQDWLPRLIQNFKPYDACPPPVLHLDSTDPLAVETDPFYLGRIIRELLVNAYKHATSPQEIQIQVGYLSLLNGDSHPQQGVCITISNSACITPEDLPHIFETFRQGSHDDRWATGGTGLGLGMVKRMVESLNGVIGASSQGGLTHFSVWIPV